MDALDQALQVNADVVKIGFEPSIYVGSAFVDIYTKLVVWIMRTKCSTKCH